MENKLTQIVFSPAGSTKKVADSICNSLRANFDLLDLSKENEGMTMASNQVILAAMPVFGGRIPALAKERLLKLHANGSLALAIVVYGNRAYDDALLELKDTLEAIGCKVIAAAAFIGQHSMVNDIAGGRPDARDLKDAERFASLVEEKLNSLDNSPVTVPGNKAYQNKKAGNGMVPKAGKACTACGFCAKNCPVSAIPLSDPRKTEKNCIGCMRCVSICPNHARSLAGPVKMLVGVVLGGAKKNRKEAEFFI